MLQLICCLLMSLSISAKNASNYNQSQVNSIHKNSSNQQKNYKSWENQNFTYQANFQGNYSDSNKTWFNQLVNLNYKKHSQKIANGSKINHHKNCSSQNNSSSSNSSHCEKQKRKGLKTIVNEGLKDKRSKLDKIELFQKYNFTQIHSGKKGRKLQLQTQYINPLLTRENLEYEFCAGNFENGGQKCYTNEDQYETSYTFTCSDSKYDSEIYYCIMPIGGNGFINNTYFTKQGILLQWFSYSDYANVLQCADDAQGDMQCVFLFEYNKTKSFTESDIKCVWYNSTSTTCNYIDYINSVTFDLNCFYDYHTNAIACQGLNGSYITGNFYILLQNGITYYSGGNSTDVTLLFSQVDLENSTFIMTNLFDYNQRSLQRVKTPQSKQCRENQYTQILSCNEIDGLNYQYNCYYYEEQDREVCYGIEYTISEGRIQTTYYETGYMYNADEKNTSIQVHYCETNIVNQTYDCTYLYSIQQYGNWSDKVIYNHQGFIDNLQEQIPKDYKFLFCKLEIASGVQTCSTNMDDYESIIVNECLRSNWNNNVFFCIGYFEGVTTNSTYLLKQNLLLQWNDLDNIANVFQCQFDDGLNTFCNYMFSYNKNESFVPKVIQQCRSSNQSGFYACQINNYNQEFDYQCSFDNVSISLVCIGVKGTISEGFSQYIQLSTGISTYSMGNSTNLTISFCDVSLSNYKFFCNELYTYDQKSLRVDEAPLKKSCYGNSSSGFQKCLEYDGSISNQTCKYYNQSNTLVCLDLNEYIYYQNNESVSVYKGGRNYTTYLNSGIQYGTDSITNNTVQVYYCKTDQKFNQNCTYLYNIDYFGGMTETLNEYMFCSQNILGDLLCNGIPGSTSEGLKCFQRKDSNVTYCNQEDEPTYCMYQYSLQSNFIISCTNEFHGKSFEYQQVSIYSDVNNYMGIQSLYSNSSCKNVNVEKCPLSIHYNPQYIHQNFTKMNLTYYFTEDSIHVRNSKNGKLKIGQYGSYCLSADGKGCYSDYGQHCDLSTGYMCAIDVYQNLDDVMYCYTQDNFTCYYDSGNYCKDSKCYNKTQLSISNSSYCASSNGNYCISFEEGFYMTNDFEIVVAQNQIFEEAGYCYSQDGQNCTKSIGQYCNLTTGYMCARDSYNNIIELGNCYTQDNITCFTDWGQYCNYTGNYPWCNIKNYTWNQCSIDLQNSSLCRTIESGYYYTEDGIYTMSKGMAKYNSNNSTYGSYCYSDDGEMCLYDYGQDCNKEDQSNCSTIDGVTPVKVGYFLTTNGSQVYIDIGAEQCNFTGSDYEIWCNIDLSYYNVCASIDGEKCYNFNRRYYITYDNYTVNQDSQANESRIYGYENQYCWSDNGETCEYNFGDYCDQNTGSDCSQQQGYYCVTLDNNKTCYKDYGEYCNNTNKAWCLIDFYDNNCFTIDGRNCYNFGQGFCYTYDLIQCTTQDFSTQLGSYCWTKDGKNCTGLDVPTCKTYQSYIEGLNGQNCGQNATDNYCITTDGIECLQDYGYFCNNTYDLRECNIREYDVDTCLTIDLQSCELSKYTNLDPTASNQFKRRQNFRDYFYYAIDQRLESANQISSCQDCSYWEDSCCVQVNQTVNDSTGSYQNTNFDNLCMNKLIVHNQMIVHLDNSTYTLQCRIQSQFNMNAFNGIQYTFKFIFAAVLVYLSAQ